MSHLSPKRAARLALLLAVGVLAVGIAGCGVDHRTNQTNVSQDELSAGGEPYFNAGPVSYQVQESRQLNPFAPDDAQYFTGLPLAQHIFPNQLWFGVFLWAKNQTENIEPTADRFLIVDSSGTVYPATPLDSSINPFAWSSEKLAQNQVQPAVGSVASNGPTGGGLILFKLNQSIYSNRPLTLLVFAPGATNPSRVSLDL